MLLGVLASVVGLAACDREEPGRVRPPAEALDVTVVRPVTGDATVGFPATIGTVERAGLATRTSGTVVRVPVDVGDAVARGGVVLVLDDSDVEARIRRAEAELDRARRSLARLEPLAADGAATGQELDDARARFRVAEAAVAEARAQRDYTVLRAPFSGVVTSRYIDPGDLAVPGRLALELAGTGALEAVADLPASLEGRVRSGDTLTLVLPETGDRRSVRVARVSPALQSGARRFRVEAAVPAEVASGLAPGAYVRLELPDPGRDRTLWVPAEAVVRRGQLTGVFTVEADTARLRWVRPGYEREGRVEVLAGLSPADMVVGRPPEGLEDGTPVRVVGEEAAMEPAESAAAEADAREDGASRDDAP